MLRIDTSTEVQVALQGTLETFALPDVLRLLASTKKTGVLRVDNKRGHGELHVVEGALTGGSVTSAPRADQPADVLFELLRSPDGAFVFDTETEVPTGATGEDVEDALGAAEAQLAEWREIEAVVPSPRRLVTITPDRGDEDLTVSGPQWRAIAAIGGGCTVDELGARLGLPELPAARVVRDLVRLGAVDLGPTDVDPGGSPPPPPPAPPAEPEQAWQPDAPTFGEVADQTLPQAPAFERQPPADPPPPPPTPSFTADPPAAARSPEDLPSGMDDGHHVTPLFGAPSEPPTVDLSAGSPTPPPSAPATSWDAGTSFAPAESSSFFDDDDDDDSDPLADDPFGPDPFRIPRLPTGGRLDDAEDTEAAEMARQLANLSPKAAQAVAAAAAATSDEEREQALAQVSQETDEPINRGLLLKFLSSVDE